MKWNCQSGTIAVEVGAREFRDVGLELGLARQAPAASRARRGDRCRIPASGSQSAAERILRARHRNLGEGEEALLDRAAEAPEVHARIEHDDPDDHHQVGRAVHAQPRGVDRGHSFRFGVIGLQ